MTRSRTFKSGNSQAVRIPQELQLPYGEVEIVRRGRELIITPVQAQDGLAVFQALTAFEGDIRREQPAAQERDELL
ncbi:AbrB/MazE/SpoVT family DNA-binding domain-containing protein [Deinococcus sp. HMF7620]|uniref:AbrB/MazE/SpoVT family DNA-binding domain-containing protein n=1 Tax=Deinococcus arboris TaxID=2682977 RepID=A0A7C9HP71_9DEIO|nr:AbrB/MazE/SpoVT family DNA-binding domain-containing protein [Deinococcus arboris]MVN85234.1 AbrB/MazE/SpoVT family DNA-binding domain-containing protein [Deinococcus arboris]